MKTVCTVILLVFYSSIFAQDYKAVDEKVDRYPGTFDNPNGLVTLISADFERPEEKVRAVFRWVATHVQYDMFLEAQVEVGIGLKVFSYKDQKEKDIKEKKFLEELALKTFVSQRAICHGYAALIEYLSLKLGITAKTVLGTLKSSPEQIGMIPGKADHAWNGVFINGKWELIDATLAAGYISERTESFEFHYNEAFFFMNPNRFVLNHYPTDEKWLLTQKSKKEFADLPLFFGSYFSKNYRINAPLSGTVSPADNQLVLSIEGLEFGDVLQYFLSERPGFEQANLSDLSNIIIPLDGMHSGYVSIFVNKDIVAMFKIAE
ncbi:MAG: hypothetical protein CFE23_11585 [Flavobacterium sp. BFFFF1]|uniref:transglutaminase domain-containing protein n=1 Tax=Flavobacterium sp. BFFFF1 TaxID=2015557 RepID=UPI000BC678C8|nr:transglutaminase domain-containing protein [Flavobacterium sp. BFFFF1]OYU80020.1 MAG: hypothetical protein CFE23_11585 [Flavobacterium sp. BFFFF1]